jgi:predicted GIY-YIG superfamily endonuclease
MHYVYLLRSESVVDQRYVGVISDLKRRVAEHNAGKVSAHFQIHSLEAGDLPRLFGRAESRDF